MGSDSVLGKSILDGIKAGMLATILGSMIATPIASILFIDIFPIPPNTAYSIAITTSLCIHGVFLNFIPYSLAGFIISFFEIRIKSIVLTGVIAMLIAITMGAYYGIVVDISEIKTSSDLLLGLAFYIALFFPYFFVFILLNLFRVNRINA